MRVLLVALLLIIALPALAQKQPWEWTIQERITARTDPAKIRQRLIALEANRPDVQGTTADGRRAEPSDVIRGSSEPELFLPTEILTTFVASAYVGPYDDGEGFRMDASVNAAEAGLPPDFLTAFEREAREFIAAQNEDHALRNAMAAGSVDAHRAMAELKLLEDTRLCPLRYALVERMREIYGQKFDRFLYAGIVRGMSLSYFGGPREIDSLRREAWGCS